MATLGNHGNEPQLNGLQQEPARQTLGHNQGVPQAEPPPEQPPMMPWEYDPAQPDIVKLPRPPLRDRSERSTSGWKIRIGDTEHSLSREKLAFCARQPKSRKMYWDVHGLDWNEKSIPHETLVPIQKIGDLFKQIRKAERELRSPFRRLLSLKRVGGFGLYRCHPDHKYHSNPEISHETTQCLVELYRNYRTENGDYEDYWMNWIGENFNNKCIYPEHGHFALLLLLQWSPLKLIIWSSIPIIFSLVIGLWYMINPNPGEDYVAIVQTAWTIASYIVTATALVLAVIASITQFGDI